MSRKYLRAVAFVLFLNILAVFPLLPCGPFFPDYVYTPEDILSMHSPYRYNPGFSGTNPGIISPSWRVRFLYQAYRGLTCGNAHMVALPERAPDAQAHWDWLEARKSVTERPAEVNRWAEGENFAYFKNYLDDAFFTAVKTLNERKKVYSKHEMDIWLEGQDEVFGSIKGRLFDEELDKTLTNSLLKRDREYQRAAACFYAKRYGEAEERFRKISGNPEHPWKAYAALAAGRTLIRRANAEFDAELKRSGGKQEGVNSARRVRDEWLEKADVQFEKVLKNVTFKSVHPSAERLREYIMFRLESRRRFLEAEKILMSVKHPSGIGWNLRDFTSLYFRIRQEDRDFILRNGGDFSRWLLAWHCSGDELAGFAAENYFETKSLPWLLASLKTMPANSLYRNEILKDASGIPESSPAYLSARYYYFAFLVKSGGDAERLAAELDSLIKALDPGKDPVSWNLFADLRMLVSQSLEEALKHSLRKVAAVDFGGVYCEQFSGDALLPDKKVQRLFSGFMPLDKWMEKVLREDLFTREIMRQLRFTAFTRAVLLDDFAAAEKIASKLSKAGGKLKKDLSIFLDSKTSAEKRFAAAFFILNYPRLNTVLDSASDEIIAENLPVDKRDVYRRNWWDNVIAGKPAVSFKMEQILRFLPGGLTSRAAEENGFMKSIVAPNYLADAVIRYAGAFPEDARVPEALHLAVQATRYASGKDEKTGGYSRRAFQLLHAKYPGSEWTEKTPYWYR